MTKSNLGNRSWFHATSLRTHSITEGSHSRNLKQETIRIRNWGRGIGGMLLTGSLLGAFSTSFFTQTRTTCPNGTNHHNLGLSLSTIIFKIALQFVSGLTWMVFLFSDNSNLWQFNNKKSLSAYLPNSIRAKCVHQCELYQTFKKESTPIHYNLCQ